MKRTTIWLFLILCLFSCRSLEKDKNVTQSIEHVQAVKNTNKEIKANLDKSDKSLDKVIDETDKASSGSIESAAKIKVKAENIKADADNIDSKTDGKVKTEVDNIKDGVDIIKTEADNIIALQEIIKLQTLELQSVRKLLEDSKSKIDSNTKLLNLTESKLKKSATKISRLEKEVEIANSEVEKQTKAKLMWMVIGGIIAVALCIASAINGNAKAWTWAGCSAVVVIAAITVSHFYVQLAWVGIIGGVALVAVLGMKMKRDMDLSKANEELIHSTEAIKETLTPKQKSAVFGDGAKPGMVFSLQSKSTEKIVNEVRKKNSTFWRPTLDK